MTAALELNDVRKSFGKTEIIRGLNLTVDQGEIHAVIGPNGAGKSTMFNLITGRFPQTSGSIRLKGQDLEGLAPFEINRLGLSRSFQITNIFPQDDRVRKRALRASVGVRLQIFLLEHGVPVPRTERRGGTDT